MCSAVQCSVLVMVSSTPSQLALSFLASLSLQIGTDFLEEEITKFEDLVQSVDVAAFNKV